MSLVDDHDTSNIDGNDDRMLFNSAGDDHDDDGVEVMILSMIMMMVVMTMIMTLIMLSCWCW